MRKTILTLLLLFTVVFVSQPATQAQRKQDKNNPPKVSLSVEKSGDKTVADFGNVEGVTAAQLKDFLTFIASDETS